MRKLLPLSLMATAVLINACSTPVAAYKISSEYGSPFYTDADNQRVDDAHLADRLQDTLKQKIAHSKILVMVNDYNVLLVGQVATAADQRQAEIITRQLPIVKKVFNHLTVNPQPKLNTDNSISNKIMQRLQLQADIDSRYMDITTVDGVVYIMGRNIGNLTALEQVLDASYTFEGVRKVVNLEQPGPRDYHTN